MNALELVPPPHVRIRFQLNDLLYLPKTSGCYALTTFDNTILYLGMSQNLSRRFVQHLNAPQKIAPTPAGKAVFFHFLSAPEEEIEKLERTWLNRHLATHGCYPFLNKLSSPVT